MMPRKWTDDDQLCFDIEFAPKHRVTIRGFRRGLTEEDKREIAQTIIERLKQH